MKEISHLICVTNPGAASLVPAWFSGPRLELSFGDVVSQADADRWKTKAPTAEDILMALEFSREAWSAKNSRLMILCDYGASRSPALGYICLADALGDGRETEAFETILKIRPCAVPNGLVVRLGDAVLSRRGDLLKPLREFNARLAAELFKPAPNSQR
jgi:predicted protein tyrosine phosphatase